MEKLQTDTDGFWLVGCLVGSFLAALIESLAGVLDTDSRERIKFYAIANPLPWWQCQDLIFYIEVSNS
jgi:hypothetical protein